MRAMRSLRDDVRWLAERYPRAVGYVPAVVAALGTVIGLVRTIRQLKAGAESTLWTSLEGISWALLSTAIATVVLVLGTHLAGVVRRRRR